MSKLLAAAALALLLVAPAAASAQRTVQLSVRGVFGDEVVLPNAYQGVRIEAQNRTARTLRGEVVLTVRTWQGPPARHRVRLDLPPRATRSALVSVFVGESGTTVEGKYLLDGATLASAAMSPGYSPSAESLVVLANPPRARGPLTDIDVEIPGTPWAGPRQARLPVGVVTFDALSGDPVLPTDGVAWGTVRLLVAHAPELARVGPAEMQAIRDWIRSGGQMIVFPRSDADLRDPAIRALVGDVTRVSDDSLAGAHSFVPEGARGYTLRGPTVRSEPFGASARLGFGRVYVTTFDGAVPPYVDTPEVRELVRAILSRPFQHGVTRPLLPYGAQDDVTADNWYAAGPSFTQLRSALDPNEGYRPALGLVAIVLLLYVVVVGPLNFHLVGRTNRPTVALLTTPVAALGCLAVLLGVGYIGKGTRMRYRRVEVIEVVEGDREGPSRRYGGLFLTRPTDFDLPSPDRGVVRTVRSAGADSPPIVDHTGERPVLRDVRGRLWETVFIREDRVSDLGGAIVFERSGRRLVAVRNGTPHALLGAVIIDAVGGVYPVGDVPAGGRAAIAPLSRLTLQGPGTPMFWGAEDPNLGTFADVVGMREDEERELLQGVARVFGGSLVTPPMPTLFARMEVPESDERVAGLFGSELDHRFVRVVPDETRQEELTPAPPPPPPMGTTP